jgi:two-component system sensor histidine kinase/response regulator
METQGNGKPRILVVDDEPSAQATIEALLFREEYDLIFLASGQEALARMGEVNPDVVLLDVMMPGMDGLEVCRRLKADERWRHVPVIMVTALDSKQDLARGLGAGADDFLHKPVNGIELRARVRSMLRIKTQFDELQATLRLREDLADMIVHDLRNPLTVISLRSSLLRKKLDDPNDLKSVDDIRAQARRLDTLLNDLLAQAKMREGKLLLSRSAVDVNQLVRETAEAQGAVARSGRIELTTDLPSETRFVSLDANLFRRVLDNLLSNALKFSPPGSAVALRVDYPPGGAAAQPFVRIQVLDEGPGIPEEHRQRIFERYEIVRLKRKNVPQVGLGLAFCKMAVEAHGGQISVTDNEPKGSIFTVLL